MTTALAGIMSTAVRPPIHCPAVVPCCPGPVPAGVRVVREEDALSLVADSALALAARGHAPVITDANSVRLVRLGALMLAEFGVGGREEDDDD